MGILPFHGPDREPAADSASGAVRALILDDDVVERRLFRRAAERSGIQFDLTEAASLDEFRAAIAMDSYQVVFLDLNLGEGNGLDALDLIAGDGSPATIVISDQTDPSIAAEAFRRGCADYVEKSELSPKFLARTVSGALWGDENRSGVSSKRA